MSNYPPEKQQGPYANIPQEGQGYNSNYGPPPPDMKTGQNFTGAPYYGAPVPMGDGGATSASAGPGHFSGVQPGPPTEFVDPTVPRPNDILPLHPAIIQQRQIAASLPPCSKGGYHELRTHHALGFNAGTFLSVICFPIVCCCVRDETVCIKCNQKFDNIVLPRIN